MRNNYYDDTYPSFYNKENSSPTNIYPDWQFCVGGVIGRGWWCSYGSLVLHIVVEDKPCQLIMRYKNPNKTHYFPNIWQMLWNIEVDGDKSIEELKQEALSLALEYFL